MKTPCHNPDHLKGEWLVVFDSIPWTRTGDVGDNSQFWKAAQVVECYWIDGDQLVDVRFIDNRKRISRGHFLHGTSSITPYWKEKIDAL